MDFKTLQSSLSSLIGTIQNTAIASVKSLRSNLYQVKVVNPVTKVEVKGTVTVGNQRNLESKVSQVEKAIKELDKSVKSESRLERTVKVSNQTSKVLISNLDGVEKLSKEGNSLVSNLIKSVQSLHIPTKFEVTNQIDPNPEIKRVVSALGDVEKAVKGLKLDPTINVAPPERLVVPPAQVNVEKTEIDYQKLSEAISSQIPEFDYQKLADVLSKEIASMVVTVGGSRGGASHTSRLNNGQEFVNNRKVEGLITYYGTEKPTGEWLIRKDDATDINNMVETYASAKNNPTKTTYSSAWSAKTTLTYGLYSDTL